MKSTILLAGIMFLAGSAHAQMMGGSSLNSSTSLNPPHSSVSNSEAAASTPQTNVSATNPGEFVPSTFETYREAVINGQQELDARPLRVAEAARIVQASKKSDIQKPALVVEQDDNGKIIISGGKQSRLGKGNYRNN